MQDVQAEVHDAGLTLRHVAAIEGPAWMCEDFDAAWDDLPRRQRILELARLAEQSPAVAAMSPHVAFICSR